MENLSNEVLKRLEKLDRMERDNRERAKEHRQKKLDQGCKQYLFTVSQEASLVFESFRKENGLSLNAAFEELIKRASTIQIIATLPEPEPQPTIEPTIEMVATLPETQPQPTIEPTIQIVDTLPETQPQPKMIQAWITPDELARIPKSERREHLKNIIIELQKDNYPNIEIVKILNQRGYRTSQGKMITILNIQGIYR